MEHFFLQSLCISLPHSTVEFRVTKHSLELSFICEELKLFTESVTGQESVDAWHVIVGE